uniref:Uncharacterized protein n=1 Tax=Rhizophora mucronata TaxID=61149 RepID=A0A2P2P372_RHIMU
MEGRYLQPFFFFFFSHDYIW